MFSAEATYQTSTSPLIARLNMCLFRRGIESRFLTTFYGILGADGSFTYTNAGHNAPVLLSSSGVQRLETGGLVLGLFEHAKFEEETLVLKPGDCICAFSDGVTEAQNAAGEEFSDDRLIACLERNRGGTPEAMLNAVVAEVRAFTGDESQNDDVTVVMVKYESR
jgi:sigma-B regulation protein RsbU (phosphoserine phosphatase)